MFDQELKVKPHNKHRTVIDALVCIVIAMD